MTRILGAVLAGGRSSRFGSDKAMALLDGRTLLAHAVAQLAPHAELVAICGRTEPGLLCLPDRPCPGLGPLGGLNAALRHAAGHDFAGVLSIGCDMPLLPAELARALVGGSAAVLQGQHLAGFWPACLGPALDRHLAETEDRSIAAWLRTLSPRRIPAPALPNINTIADLAAVSN